MKEPPKMKEQKKSAMTTSTNYGTNYAIFRWTQGQWVIDQNACAYGCVPAPPVDPGEYEGQRVTTGCVPLA